MSDSSPENFMEQALALITQLKKALEASFVAQDKHIDKRIDDIVKLLGEQVATQKNRIDTIAGDFTSLNNKFQKHKTDHVSQSSVDKAIKEQISSHSQQQHKQELQEIKSGYISVQQYNTQIQEFKDRIVKLEAQIETITQPTTLSKVVQAVPELLEAQIETITQSKVVQAEPENAVKTEHSDEPPAGVADTNNSVENNAPPANSAPPAKSNPSAAGVSPTQDTKNKQHTPTTSTDPGEHDPDVSTLETAILKEIRNSNAYTSIINNKRGKILNKANELKQSKTPPVDNVLHMQVILALHTLKNKPSKNSIPLYNGCYNNDLSKLTELKNIIREFIGENDLIVTVATFKDAVDDHKNFKSIMTAGAVDGGDYTAFEKAIKST